MKSNKLFLLMAMLVLAVFAVGSVSAAENVTTDIDVQTDDIALDDVSVEDAVDQEEIVEQTRSITPYNVDNTTDIQSIIDGSTDSIIINFANQTYKNFALTLNNSVTLNGNGAKLIGDGSHDLFTVTGKTNIVITGFIMDINSSTHAAVYGSGVSNIVVSNNTIQNGRDGISYFRSYDNVTIEGNRFDNISRDAISLANPLGTANWDNLVGAVINNNNISNAVYGIFIGGAFKGTISNNNIINGTYGMEFAGKPTASQGNLCVAIVNTTITNYTTGINMFHPNIICLLFDNVNITVNDNSTEYAINTNYYFHVSGSIVVESNCHFNGLISEDFEDEL